MNKNIKLLLQGVNKRELRRILSDHIRDIAFDEVKKEVTVLIDKKYIINRLGSTPYRSYFVDGIQGIFGNKNHISMHLAYPHIAHNREVLIPYKIHY